MNRIERKIVSGITLTLLVLGMLILASKIQPVKARSDSTIGFYGMTYEIYSDSLVSYLKTLGYTVFAVDELSFKYADVVYLDYRDVYPLTEEDLLDYVENGGNLWVGGEACGESFLGVTISTNSIWFVGSLSDPRVWIMEHPVLRDVRSIAYPDGAWLEITGNIEGIMLIDGKTTLAVDSSRRGRILWLIDSDIFGDYFLDDEDNRVLARNIAAWLMPRTWTVDDDGPADFHTIQEAINAASSGDTIYVYNGTYYETVVVNKTLSLLGEDKNGTFIDGRGIGNVVTLASNSSTINGFTIRESGVNETEFIAGIFLNYTNYCTITNNNILNNQEGITFIHSSNNTITGNEIRETTWTGIFLLKSSNNTISENNIKNNNEGLYLSHLSNKNAISRNNIENNNYGIYFFNSSLYNVIFHNSFINNTEQVHDFAWENIDFPPSNNIWDDGYPSGGNYWRDYTSVDIKNGPTQDLPGSDGIGDTSYVIGPAWYDNLDHYPLMNPYDAPPPTIYILTITTTVGGTTNPASGAYGYTANSTVQVTAIPNANYLLDHWELDSVNVGSASPYTVLMDKNHTLKAFFSPIPKPPVGGYSFQIEGYTTTQPITTYLTLIAILTIGFTATRHKTKRKTK